MNGFIQILFVLFPRSGTSYASPKKYPACGGHAKKGDPKTLLTAGRDVHRPDLIGINCFREGASIKLCAAEVNSIRFLIL